MRDGWTRAARGDKLGLLRGPSCWQWGCLMLCCSKLRWPVWICTRSPQHVSSSFFHATEHVTGGQSLLCVQQLWILAWAVLCGAVYRPWRVIRARCRKKPLSDFHPLAGAGRPSEPASERASNNEMKRERIVSFHCWMPNLSEKRLCESLVIEYRTYKKNNNNSHDRDPLSLYTNREIWPIEVIPFDHGLLLAENWQVKASYYTHINGTKKK